jgi:hypothetical protein
MGASRDCARRTRKAAHIETRTRTRIHTHTHTHVHTYGFLVSGHSLTWWLDVLISDGEWRVWGVVYLLDVGFASCVRKCTQVTHRMI